jgi:transcription termination factor Rho
MARNHVQIAEIVLERAKRLVETGRDVVVLLDSITRLSRAYNTEQRGSGRVLSGGIDARTMEKPRRFFGAARKAHEGGSLTVIGTALVDTGSRMDEVIFQEFKGTGNTEIIMDRGLFDRRIFPAIDISKSGTRKEEKLFSPDEYQKVTLLRRALAPLKAAEAMQLLTGRLAKSGSNAEFLADMHN